LDTKKRQNWVGIFREKTILCQLDSLLQDPNLINKQLEDLPGQYYLLKRILQSYHNIAEKGAGIQLSFQKNQIALHF
jgi:hypothetical protein